MEGKWGVGLVGGSWDGNKWVAKQKRSQEIKKDEDAEGTRGAVEILFKFKFQKGKVR